MSSKKANVWGGWVSGCWTEVKAFRKANAVAWMQQRDASVKAGNVKKVSAVNFHQSPVDAEEI